MWWSSACATCEYHDSDFDELTNKEDEWCEKGHDGLKGFPFQKKPRCYSACTWKISDKEYWEKSAITNQNLKFKKGNNE